MLRKTGLILVGIGGATLLTYIGYYYVTLFLLNPVIPLIIRLALTAIPLGFLLVLASLVRERLRDKKREDFKGVED